ncbi:MAG: hypothetical protein HUJ78_02865 [Mogibacterium sp.]|nr:hypothetical protein [Mogibacterium sp.]
MRNNPSCGPLSAGEGGGGTGTDDFDQLRNRPKYNGETMTHLTNVECPDIYQNESVNIKLPNYQKMNANGSDSIIIGNSRSSMGFNVGSQSVALVPYASHAIGNGDVVIGSESYATGYSDVCIGNNAQTEKNLSQAIGNYATTKQNNSTAIGNYAETNAEYSLAIGSGSKATEQGEINIGLVNSSYQNKGYNNTNFRLIRGVHEGVEDNDVVNLKQLKDKVKNNSVYSSKQTSTTHEDVGGSVYIGSLDENQEIIEDPSVEGHLSYFHALPVSGNAQTPTQHSINILGKGARSSGCVDIGYNSYSHDVDGVAIGKNAQNSNVRGTSIGVNTTASGESVAIGSGAQCTGFQSTAIGRSTNVSGNGAVGFSSTVTGTRSFGVFSVNTASAYGFGFGGNCSGTGSVALGAFSEATRQGEINVGSAKPEAGYNSTNYRLISGVHDGEEDHDVATVGQLKALIEHLYPVGSVVMGDTLETEDKVREIYGGLTWQQITGTLYGLGGQVTGPPGDVAEEAPNVIGNMSPYIHSSNNNIGMSMGTGALWGSANGNYCNPDGGSDRTGNRPRTMNLDLSKGQTDEAGVVIEQENSVYKNGGHVKPEGYATYVWKRIE